MLSIQAVRERRDVQTKTNRTAEPASNVERQALAAGMSAPILSVFRALIVHSELKSVHPGFPVAFIL